MAPVTYKLGAGWESVEAALHGWLSTQTGAAARWFNPEVPLPSDGVGMDGDFALLRVVGFYPRGLTATVHHVPAPARPPEEGLERIQRRPGMLVIAVDLLTVESDGVESAFPRLCAAAAALDSLQVFRPLRRAGLGLQAKGDVRSLTGLLGIAKHGRAALELRFNVGEEVREFTGELSGLRVTRVP